jgi:hypothetical protein
MPVGLRRQGRARGERHRHVREAHLSVGDDGMDEVHGRRADEGGDKEVDRVAEEVLRCGALLQDAVAEHRDPLAERHRLHLVVGDVHRRDTEPLMQQRELGPHADAQLGVEVR